MAYVRFHKLNLVLISVLIGLPDLAFAQSAEELLTRDLKVGIKSMPSEVRVYNYFNVLQTSQELVSPEGRANYLKRYFDGSMSRFWDPNAAQVNFINAGPGLYAAIDPFISKQFGNTLVELTVQPGTVYIDVVNPLPVSKDTLSALIKEGYLEAGLVTGVLLKVSDRYAFTRDTLKNMINPSYKSFRQLVQNIFVKSSIGMVEYNWDTSLSIFCRRHSYSAFVFTGVLKSSDGKMYYEENVGKTLLYGVALPNLTSVESEAGQRVAHFRELLEQLKLAPTNKDKSNLVLRYYPNESEKDDIINKTFSCVK
jgi:hypothetical protein